jgi:uncharacterized membrane protein YgaE (UPF0421/DUF939 family)
LRVTRFARLRAERDRIATALGAQASGRIGLSYAIRTTVAALASMYLANALGLASPIWAVVSAVVVILPGHRASIASAVLRVIANLTGAGVGIAVASVGMPPLAELVIGLLAVALVCRLLAIDAAARSASVSLIVVLLRDPSGVRGSSETRVLQVMLGCGVALVVTLVVAGIERWLAERSWRASR